MMHYCLPLATPICAILELYYHGRNMNYQPGYPTMEHAKAADEIVAVFRESYPIDALLLVNSCATRRI